MTLGTYILNGNESGMHKERKQYSEGTTEGASGAVSDHSTTRKRETIRHNKSESYRTKYSEAGSKGGARNAVRRFHECRNGSELCGMRGGVRNGAKDRESSC